MSESVIVGTPSAVSNLADRLMRLSPEQLELVARYIDMTEIQQLYQVSDPETVGRFVRNHPEITSLLREAAGEIARVFGDNVDLALKLYNFGSNSGGEHLYALVRSQRDVNTSLDLLDQLNQSWWLDNMTRANGDLDIDVEFG